MVYGYTTYTGGPNDKVKIKTVTIKPDPPKIGQNIDVVADVTFCKFCTKLFFIAVLSNNCSFLCVVMSNAAEKVTGGKVNVQLIFDKIPFISLHLDLCDEAPLANLSCPIGAGDQTLHVNQLIPDEAPKVLC